LLPPIVFGTRLTFWTVGALAGFVSENVVLRCETPVEGGHASVAVWPCAIGPRDTELEAVVLVVRVAVEVPGPGVGVGVGAGVGVAVGKTGSTGGGVVLLPLQATSSAVVMAMAKSERRPMRKTSGSGRRTFSLGAGLPGGLPSRRA